MAKRGRPRKTPFDKLLETLIQIEQNTNRDHYDFLQIKQLQEIQTECLVFLMQNQNKRSVVCEKFGKEMEVRLNSLGLNTKWTYFGKGKQW